MMPSLTRAEWLFLAAGGLLGALVAGAGRAGWISPSAGLPLYLFVLIGLGLLEVLVGLAMRTAPGAFVRMPARLLAFVLGVGVLALVYGGIA